MNYTSNTKGRLSVLGQICKLIPPHLVPKTLRRLAEEQGVKIQARSFSVWSHIVSLLSCHVGHCLSINDICDSLGLHGGLLNSIRNATAPRRNTLSQANKTRSSEVIKAVYSDILAHCRAMHPAFCARGHRCYFRFPRKLKRVVRAIDSTTIELISKCMDWAKHRKRKAAAKLHMSLDAASFLPVRIVPEPAKHHDSRFMVELCSGMKPGEIAVFDKAYVAYGHLHTLNERGIFRVTRAKDNACFDTKGKSGTGAGATSSATMRWNCTPIRAAGSIPAACAS